MNYLQQQNIISVLLFILHLCKYLKYKNVMIRLKLQFANLYKSVTQFGIIFLNL